MARKETMFAAALALLLLSGRALAWNASFERAARANTSFATFGTLDSSNPRNLTVTIQVERAMTALQELFGYAVAFHCTPTLAFSRCGTEKSVGDCLDEKGKKQEKAEDVLAQIRKGDRLIFSGRYDPRRKQLVISRLVVWQRPYDQSR